MVRGPSVRCPRWWPSQYRDKSIPTGTGCSVLAPKRKGCIRRREPQNFIGLSRNFQKLDTVLSFGRKTWKKNQSRNFWVPTHVTHFSSRLSVWNRICSQGEPSQLPPSQAAIKQTKNSKSFRASKVVDSTCLGHGVTHRKISELMDLLGYILLFNYASWRGDYVLVTALAYIQHAKTCQGMR